MIFGLPAIGIVDLRAVGIVGHHVVVSCMLETSTCIGGTTKIFNFEPNTCNLFSFVQPPLVVQTILPPCHRRLIAPTLRHSPVLHRSPGGHTCSLHRRSSDVELCDVELVILNL